MKRSLAHRLTALLGMLAMLVSLLAVPVASAATMTKSSESHAAQLSATSEASTGHALHHRHVAAATADKSHGASHKIPCEDPCPSCPKGKHDMAGCVVKCFQSPAASLSCHSRLAAPRGAAVLAPAPPMRLTGLRVLPRLRPPIL